MWCIPPEQDAAFVCQMEQVLEVYKRPYAQARTVVCMDEQTKQLVFEARQTPPGEDGAASATCRPQSGCEGLRVESRTAS